MNQKTYWPKESEIERKWYQVDISGRVLGRTETNIANLLRGKNKPYFSPSIDCGDFVVVTNASKVKLTGKKLEQKIEYHHSGYTRGDKYTPYKKLLSIHPERIIHLAVSRMLPKNKLRAKFLKRLKIYADENHSHIAQNPVKIDV